MVLDNLLQQFSKALILELTVMELYDDNIVSFVNLKCMIELTFSYQQTCYASDEKV